MLAIYNTDGRSDINQCSGLVVFPFDTCTMTSDTSDRFARINFYLLHFLFPWLQFPQMARGQA